MPKLKRQIIPQFILLSFILFSTWILLSGKFEVKFLLIGLFSSLVISFICMPFLTFRNPATDKEYFLFGINYLKFIPYCLWLFVEIVKASISVTKQVFKRNLDYEPRVVSFSMPFENPLASVLLANSIILTPGTITIDVTDNGIFEVHALDECAAADLYTGTMAYKVAALFNEKCKFEPLYELENKNITEFIGEDF